MIFAGIDAGSTKTRAVLADARGHVLGVGTGATCNLVVVDRRIALRNLGDTFRMAANQASLPLPLNIASGFFGVAGIVSPHDKLVFADMVKSLGEICCGNINVANDIELVLAGGLGESEGIALISGTGSNCLGKRSDGRKWQVGGREWLVDDRGSGFRLGLEGITAALRSADGRSAATILETSIFHALGIRDLTDVIRRLHGHGGPETLIQKQEVAALAPLVIDAAMQGDDSACRIVDLEVSELAHMVYTVAARLDFLGEAFRWTVAGSIGNTPYIFQRLRMKLGQIAPLGRYVSQKLTPEFGAVLLAAESVQCRPDAAFVRNLPSIQ